MMARAPPRLGPVLVCTPTFETVPPPLVIVKPTPPAVEHIEDITTTDTDGHWADLLLFLTGAAFLVFIAHKLHQHRLANGTPVLNKVRLQDCPTKMSTFTSDSAITDYLKGLSPSSLDMELRMLQIIDDDEVEESEEPRPIRAPVHLIAAGLLHS
ncbi:hypothetical protein ZWY2020_024588 [Hordeum vulgare]|nr:hypothetical protein ZWY2020_024588 [Hordeum vulgare]